MSKKIPGLSDLAKRLSDFSFPDETRTIGEAVRLRAANGDIHNCYPAGKHNVVVQFFLGGAQRTIGYTDNANDAARFADMARVRFHQYRARGSSIRLTDQDMNLDLNQVRVDSEEVPEAVALLDDIEHLLLQAEIIKPAAVRMAECQEQSRNRVPRVQIRQTQKAELLATLKEINTTQNHIYELLARMELRLNALQPREMGGSMPLQGPGIYYLDHNFK